MATTIIRNPDNVPGAVTTGYQLQNTVLFASMTGMAQVAIDREARKIEQGSVFELNGNIARVTESEDIDGSLMHEAINWVYAIPDGDTVGFHFSAVPPDWSAAKGGWYRGETNERALITAITDSNGSIVGANLLLNELDIIVPPNAGGVSAGDWNVRTHASTHLNRGWHRYIITSGLGAGNGGSGLNDWGNNVVGFGGVASVSITLSGVFFHNGGGLIVHVGGNGFNGGSGVNGVSGGGSGAGEESYIVSGSQRISTGHVRPGHGGGERGGAGILSDVMTGRGPLISGNGLQGGAADSGLPFGGVGPGAISVGSARIEAGSGCGWGGGGCSRNGWAGGGGAPGWIRDLGAAASGRVQLWRLS